MAQSSTHESTSSTHTTAPHESTSRSSSSTQAAAVAPRAAAQAVWQLRPIDPQVPPFYLGGVPQTVIVAAASAEEARKIAAAAAGPHDVEAWLNPTMSICSPLEVAEPGIVARDFTLLAPLPPATTAPANTAVPYVGGIGAVDEVLSCTMGEWTEVPTAYAYAWQSDGAPIAAATAATYTVAAGDVGHAISCIVTATNAAGSTAAPPSNAVTVA